MSPSDPLPAAKDALEALRRGRLPVELQSRVDGATTFSFIASSGPGGQNVNKVATAVQLRCDVFSLGLSPGAYRRLKTLAGSRWTNESEIVITARTHRSQEANREEARARLADLIARAHIPKVKRIPTRVSRAAKARRVDAKKQRSSVKAGRGKVTLD